MSKTSTSKTRGKSVYIFFSVIFSDTESLSPSVVRRLIILLSQIWIEYLICSESFHLEALLAVGLGRGACLSSSFFIYIFDMVEFERKKTEKKKKKYELIYLFHSQFVCWFVHTSIMADSNSILFHSATILTLNATRQIIRNGYIHILADRISSIGKNYPVFNLPEGTRIVDCKHKIIIPGLINTHAHLVQSLLRGLAEDLPLHNWLCDAVWPLEAAYDSDDGADAARLTIAEMLKTGTTCFLDPMLTHRAGFERVCEVVGDMGVRGCLVRFLSASFSVLWMSVLMVWYGVVGQTGQIHRNKSPTLHHRPARQGPSRHVHPGPCRGTCRIPRLVQRQTPRLGGSRYTARRAQICISRVG